MRMRMLVPMLDGSGRTQVWFWTDPGSVPTAKAIAAVVPQEGAGAESLRRWVVQTDIDPDGCDGPTSYEHAEIHQFKGENRKLRDDVALLKAAVLFFVGKSPRDS